MSETLFTKQQVDAIAIILRSCRMGHEIKTADWGILEQLVGEYAWRKVVEQFYSVLGFLSTREDRQNFLRKAGFEEIGPITREVQEKLNNLLTGAVNADTGFKKEPMPGGVLYHGYQPAATPLVYENRAFRIPNGGEVIPRSPPSMRDQMEAEIIRRARNDIIDVDIIDVPASPRFTINLTRSPFHGPDRSEQRRPINDGEDGSGHLREDEDGA